METESGKWSFALIEELNMPDQTDRDIRDLLCECYPEDAAVFSKTRTWNGIVPVFSLICVKKSELAGYVGVVVREVAYDSGLLVVAGVQNLAVLPRFRGESVGKDLVLKAMDEAERRGLTYGMLFCDPELEHYYVTIGWNRLANRVTMDDSNGCVIALNANLISMVRVFDAGSFPSEDIYLKGPEW